MADNRDLASLTGNCAADEVTYSGDTAVVQLMRLVGVTGSEGSKTVTEVMGTAGSPGTAVVTIQGVGSGTAVPVSIASVPSHAVTNAGTFAVQNTAATVSSTSHAVLAASTNATSVKGSAGTLYSASVYNKSATPFYLKFYNKATSPTVGTDTPILVIGVEAGTAQHVQLPQGGLAFGTGIAYAVTGGIANADTTAVAASDGVVGLIYA
jgi:hypothetical protein